VPVTAAKPDDRSKHTISFGEDNTAALRIDCNRGRAPLKTNSAGQLEFGPVMLTRAVCPPGSLYDRIEKQFPFIRSYFIKNGRLFLSLIQFGGILKAEPQPPTRQICRGQAAAGITLSTYRTRFR